MILPRRHSALVDATFAVIGADDPFAAATCVHLASTGARLLLIGQDEDRLLDVDAELAQSELHRISVSVDPEQIAAWLKAQALALDGLVVFVNEAPTPETCRALLEPIASSCGVRAERINAVVVHATLPGVQQQRARTLPDLELGPLSVLWLSARNVVPEALLKELDAKAAAGEQTKEQLLAELFGGAAPQPLFTSGDLGLLVETLLGSFARFARGRHYTFDAC